MKRNEDGHHNVPQVDPDTLEVGRESYTKTLSPKSMRRLKRDTVRF